MSLRDNRGTSTAQAVIAAVVIGSVAPSAWAPDSSPGSSGGAAGQVLFSEIFRRPVGADGGRE